MDWNTILKEESSKSYYKALQNFIIEEYASTEVYPDFTEIYRAFNLTPFDKVKVVILGQDPYYSDDSADGLAFSVKDGRVIPRSLNNILEELVSDTHCDEPTTGDLSKWAKQGVLLLNTVLTVRRGLPNSHSNKGWEIFTREVIVKLSLDTFPKVFILWGRNAISYESLIPAPHLVLTSSHPSPQSAHISFFGSKPFTKANNFLMSKGIVPIDWTL